MSGTADPWEPPGLAALQSRVARTPSVVRTGGPERIYDNSAADPTAQPRPVGFTALREQAVSRLAEGLDLPLTLIDTPLLWEGDQA